MKQLLTMVLKSGVVQKMTVDDDKKVSMLINMFQNRGSSTKKDEVVISFTSSLSQDEKFFVDTGDIAFLIVKVA